MKRLSGLIYLLLFAAVCLAADGITEWIVSQNADKYSASGHLYHLYHEHGDEIPIFGASEASIDYIPAEISPKVFCYGLSGVSLRVSESLLEVELEKAKTTPIILDLPLTKLTIGDTGTYLPFATRPEFHRLLEYYHAMEWRYLVPGLRFFGYYDLYLKEYLDARYNGTKTVQGYTHFVGEDKVDPATFRRYVQERASSSYGYFPEVEANDLLVQLISSHPQRLFFLVYAPYHPSCFVKMVQADKLKAFQDRLRSFPNVELIDWEHLNYPDSYFMDTVHLNLTGAHDFSRRFAQKMREVLAARAQASASPAPSDPRAR